MLFLLATSSMVSAQGGSEPGGELGDLALQIVAERHGRDPSELAVAAEAPLNLPLAGFEGFTFKITDGQELFDSVTLHSTSGVERNLDDLATQTATNYRAQYGKFVPAQFAERARVAIRANEPLSLVIHVVEPFDDSIPRLDPDGPPDPEKINALLEELDATNQARAEARVAPVMAWLSQKGHPAEHLPGTTMLTGIFPASVIVELERLGEVAVLSEGDLHFEPTLAVQRATMYSNVVEGSGINGNGIQVAEIEVGGIISPLNPFLSFIQDPIGACVNPHALWVAGVIRSTHSGVRGHAPACQLWVGGACSGSIGGIMGASARARNWGARVFNYSLGGNFGGTLTSLDQFVDDLSLTYWRTVVASSANGGLGGFVNSPGTAYNIITVGASDDKNSVTWVGDTMAPFSSSVNPGSWIGDREEPKMAAPGVQIETLRPATPWIGDVLNGTSFSAPAVTGIVAQMMHRNSTLSIWPEINRAILMATSIANVEGAARLSSQDGTGGVVADRADQLVRRAGGNWSGIGYNCPATPNLLNLTNMNLVAGQRVRAVISWNTDPNSGVYFTPPIRPGADLDLSVRRPGNIIVATSLSWDNTYEIVDFVAPVSGVYTMQVNKFRCNFNPQWLGWAWTVV